MNKMCDKNVYTHLNAQVKLFYNAKKSYNAIEYFIKQYLTT